VKSHSPLNYHVAKHTKSRIKCRFSLQPCSLKAKTIAPVSISPSFILLNHLLGNLSLGSLSGSNERLVRNLIEFVSS
jgi:hypothetical protein